MTLGGGLALGVGFKLGQGNAPVLDQPEPPNLDPILDRLEKVETTVASVEQVLNSPSPMVYTPAAQLEDQVKNQGGELAALRAQILQIDRSHATQMDELSQTVSGLEHRIPDLIDESIRPRFEALHERVQREMQETASQTLELFADRIQSRVTDAAGHAHVPAFRLHWKPSVVRPVPSGINLDDVFQVQRPHTGPHTRQVNAARCIRYRKQSYHFPTLHKGDVIEVNEGKDQIDFAYLGTVVQSIRKPLHQHTATTRKVHTGGLVKFKQQRLQLDLPKGTYVVVLREGQDYLFYLGDQVVFRMTGQEKCHPCI